jgi:GT2 family glycosyltransferase
MRSDNYAPGDGRADLETERWAIVIPSFNHAEDATTCLASIWAAVRRPEHVILVDDASTDGAVATISEWALCNHVPCTVTTPGRIADGDKAATWLTILASPTNSGFSVSCNKGLRYALDSTEAPYVLLLNNDAALSSSYFQDLAGGMRGNASAGLVTGTIYEWDQRTVWYAGGRFNPLRAVAEHDLVVPPDGQPRSTPFVCGCTMLISRHALETVGLLPECYSPCYCEDADYSLAVSRAGFPLLYVPRAAAYHRVSSSLGREVRPPQVIFWFTRNRAFAMRRNYRGWKRAGGMTYLALTKPARAIWEVIRGRPRSGGAFIRGTIEGFFSPITPK